MKHTGIETIELNTGMVDGLFSGTYESPYWDIRDEQDDNGNMLYSQYDHKDLMQSIAHVYQNNNDFILDELGIDFIKKINFTGSFYSPREYNFKTDELDFTIDVDMKALYKTLNKLQGNEDFNTFLREHYSSRDGFISFTPDNYNDLYNAIVTVTDEYEQAISALINYLFSKKFDKYNHNTIEEQLADEWQGNGYSGMSYDMYCYECDKKISWDDKTGYNCQNKDCKLYKEVEPVNENQLKLI